MKWQTRPSPIMKMAVVTMNIRMHISGPFQPIFNQLESNNKLGVLRLGFVAELYKTVKGW